MLDQKENSLPENSAESNSQSPMGENASKDIATILENDIAVFGKSASQITPAPDGNSFLYRGENGTQITFRFSPQRLHLDKVGSSGNYTLRVAGTSDPEREVENALILLKYVDSVRVEGVKIARPENQSPFASVRTGDRREGFLTISSATESRVLSFKGKYEYPIDLHDDSLEEVKNYLNDRWMFIHSSTSQEK